MSNVTQRTYRANICKEMPYKSVQFPHSTGNYKGDYVFLWRVSTDHDESTMTSHNTKTIQEIEQNMPVYHT